MKTSQIIIACTLSVLLAGSVRSQEFVCPPCGMECDNTTYKEGGICPHEQCHRILQWQGVPSLIWPKFDSNSGKLLLTLQSGTDNRLYVLQNGKLRDLNIEGENANYSPDGTRILYTKDNQIFIAKNGQTENISEKYDVAGTASWLNDTEIVLTIGDFPSTKVYALSIDSGEKRMLSDFQGFNYGVSASKQGSIAFSSLRKGLYLINGDTPPIKLHTSGEYANFSPDGKKVAFHVQENRRFSIYTCNIDGSNLKQIKVIEGFDCELPSWSMDGSEIYYMSNVRHGNWDIFKMNADGSNEQLVLKSEDI